MTRNSMFYTNMVEEGGGGGSTPACTVLTRVETIIDLQLNQKIYYLTDETVIELKS